MRCCMRQVSRFVLWSLLHLRMRWCPLSRSSIQKDAVASYQSIAGPGFQVANSALPNGPNFLLAEVMRKSDVDDSLFGLAIDRVGAAGRRAEIPFLESSKKNTRGSRQRRCKPRLQTEAPPTTWGQCHCLVANYS